MGIAAVRISQAEVALWGAAIALVGTLAAANFTYSIAREPQSVECDIVPAT